MPNELKPVIDKDYVSVSEDLPAHDKAYKNLSIVVQVLLKNGEIRTGFYADNTCMWYDANTIKPLKNVTHWRTTDEQAD